MRKLTTPSKDGGCRNDKANHTPWSLRVPWVTSLAGDDGGKGGSGRGQDINRIQHLIFKLDWFLIAEKDLKVVKTVQGVKGHKRQICHKNMVQSSDWRKINCFKFIGHGIEPAQLWPILTKSSLWARYSAKHFTNSNWSRPVKRVLLLSSSSPF